MIDSGRPMRALARIVGIAVITVSALQCSSTQRTTTRPTRPFTPDLLPYFDEAADYIDSVQGLGGRIASDWEAQIAGLSRNSDLIAEARVETLLQGADSEGREVYRLTARTVRVLRGDAPIDGRIALRVSEGQVGFNTIRGTEERLQRTRWMLFVRWYTDGAGEVRAHWHLTPYSDDLAARVRVASGIEDEEFGSEHRVAPSSDSPPEQQR